MPIAEGGSDDMTNLITLCDACHDFVEINHFTSLAEICALEEEPIEEPTAIKAPAQNDWHTWVYGGAKNPNV
jgi:hypothetical protein